MRALDFYLTRLGERKQNKRTNNVFSISWVAPSNVFVYELLPKRLVEELGDPPPEEKGQWIGEGGWERLPPTASKAKPLSFAVVSSSRSNCWQLEIGIRETSGPFSTTFASNYWLGVSGSAEIVVGGTLNAYWEAGHRDGIDNAFGGQLFLPLQNSTRSSHANTSSKQNCKTAKRTLGGSGTLTWAIGCAPSWAGAQSSQAHSATLLLKAMKGFRHQRR